MTTPLARSGLAVAALAVLPLLAACGTAPTAAPNDAGLPGAHDASATDRLGHQRWLLRFDTSGGGDGEQKQALYVALTPATGATQVTTLPPVLGGDAYGDSLSLLVDASHTWAIPDSKVPPQSRRTGKLTLYRLGARNPAKKIIDFHALTGKPLVTPAGWSFDPSAPGVLRVVDTTGQVWRVDLTAVSATSQGRLPKKPGWFFSNGFDKNTGAPFIESVNSDTTVPAGNGSSDTRAVVRQGGRMLISATGRYPGLPPLKCGFSSGFLDSAGTAWLFCADKPSIVTWQLPKGAKTWQRYGKPTSRVVAPSVAELPVVLPPAA
ncbi:MAG: hypothetical protein M3130_07695 [Actinomycetota bacterium]|nr:hypothetical protein [Actinomycetota bacterium]MDQ6935151.1 hypothetical protein [Actinomycetota bacterium]